MEKHNFHFLLLMLFSNVYRVAKTFQKKKKEYFQKREMLSTPFQVMFASENKSLCRFDTWHLWIVVVRLPLHKCLFLWRLTYFQGKTQNKRFSLKAQTFVTHITWRDTYNRSCVWLTERVVWGSGLPLLKGRTENCLVPMYETKVEHCSCLTFTNHLSFTFSVTFTLHHK